MNLDFFEKILLNKATESETELFESWLRDSKENVANFHRIKKFWNNLDNVYDQQSFDKEAAKLKIQNASMFRRQKNRITKKLVWISIAASLLIILGSTFFLIRNSVFSNEETLHYTSNDQKKEVILPDGSHVWLNSHSNLSVPEVFLKKQRNVRLWGEAYFEVKTDSLKPFTIKTGKTLIRVLGTSFNIRFDSVTSDVQVIVNSGKVSFSTLKNKNSVVLVADEIAMYDYTKNKISKSINPNENYLAWKTGILNFNETPIYEVCRILEKQYHQKINTSLTEEKYKITGSFNNEQLDDILTTISITLDLNVIQKEEGIIICQY